MAREATITQEQVNAAADATRAAGAKPTARSVREALGGGSMATVLKFLQVWQSGQVKPAAQDVTLPPALTRALVDFIGQEVAGAKSDLQADLVSAQQANGDLIAESERQAATIELQVEALELVQAEKAELAGRLAQVESDLAKAGDDVGAERQAAEHARTELAKAQLRLESLPRLEAEADRLRAELEQERTAKVAAEQTAAVATEKGTGLAERLAEAKARIEALEQQGKANAQAMEKAKERDFGLSDRIHELQSQLFAANAATARAEAQERQASADLEKKAAELDQERKARLAAEQKASAQPKAETKPKAATKKPEAKA